MSSRYSSTRYATRRPSIRAPVYRRSRRYRRRPMPAAIMRGYSRPELKSFDYSDASANAMVTVANVVGAATMTTGFTCLNVVTNGTEYYQRSGSKLSMTSLAVEADYSLAQTDFSVVVLRIMVIYDRQVNGAYPAIADILSNNNSATVTFNSAINIANRDRFLVLRDCQLTLDPASGLSRHWECYIKRPLSTSFRTNAYTDIRALNAGSIYLL